jgi:hypothetical protein
VSHNLEPFTGRELAKVVERRGGVPCEQRGGATTTFVMPTGAEVKVPLAAKSIPTMYLKKVAAGMGLTYAEVRSDLGRPVVQASRPRPVVEKRRTGASKADVQAAIATARRSLSEVEQAIKPGVRDSAFYGRVLEELGGATRSATAALSVARAQGSNR